MSFDKARERAIRGLVDAAETLARIEGRREPTETHDGIPEWLTPYLDTAVLCYIDGLCWFTTQALEKQWGDDWNDAPYDCNAGDPYTWNPTVTEKQADGTYARVPNPEPSWELLVVGYQGEMWTPDNIGRYAPSVQAINRGDRPWLLDQNSKKEPARVMAGTTLRDFIEIVRKRGECVLLPAWKVEIE